jgi:protein-S-isoprenylcysteine O-methyltransferase Ste14
MYLFLIPLLVGFGLNSASDFTAVYTRWWGERGGRLVTTGGLLILAALVTLGRWAAAPSVKDTLVDRGVYAHIRHPIYSGMLLKLAGLSLLRPNQTAWLACALAASWAFLQVRLEELDLVQRLPAYRDYMKRIPCFIP